MKAIVGDETFTRFRRKLEDRVTWAINTGRTVGKDLPFCPLGASCPSVSESAGHAVTTPAGFLGISGADAWAFADGYDGSRRGPRCSWPYYELGKLYRKRFP